MVLPELSAKGGEEHVTPKNEFLVLGRLDDIEYKFQDSVTPQVDSNVRAANAELVDNLRDPEILFPVESNPHFVAWSNLDFIES